MKMIDTRGELCPVPLIMTKKALAGLPLGTEFEVLCDNAVAFQNLLRFLTDQGLQVTHSQQGEEYNLRGTKTAEMGGAKAAEAYCTVAPASPLGTYVICISSDTMGQGDKALGSLLLKAFVNTIKEMDQWPVQIVLYNAGIFLAVEGSEVIDSLLELQQNGVEIRVCGTCLDYYNKKDQLRAGIISNMYDISQSLALASHVVYP